MKFKLRKISGMMGTEVKISVLFSPEETDFELCQVRDDENVHLDLLRTTGDDYQQADHTLQVLRSLCHYADISRAAKTNPAIRAYLVHNIMHMEAKAEARKPRRKKRKRK